MVNFSLRCVCTWCPFKSSKYSVVKKHIEIHHERKHHYPCKECVFVGQSVDDYAEHYHTFHKVSINGIYLLWQSC